MPIFLASTMMLSIIDTAMTPSSNRVVAAFFDLGLRKAGTPLLIASTPVSAAQPDENARSSRNAPAIPAIPDAYGSSATSVKWALSTCPRLPNASLRNAYAAIPRMAIMKAYVGTANAVPDSRTPRRFADMSSTTATTAMVTSWPWNASMVDAAYCEADEIETATVST